MRFGLRAFAALAMVALLVAAPVATAATAPPLDFSDDRTPNFYVHEDTLTVSEHDMSSFDSLTEYYDDGGEKTGLPASVNSTQDEQIGFRADKVVISTLQEFPRVSGESENKQTWLNTSNWTTSTSDSTNVTPSLSDADGTTATGVDAVQFSTSGMGSGDTATATFGQGVDVSSDVTKRVFQWSGQINDLSGDVEFRLVDSDGGYWYANASTAANSSKDAFVANATGNGYVFQERVSNLKKSGTPDSIDKIEIVAIDANADVVTTGMDVERKSTFDLGEVVNDRDGDGTDETYTISEINNDPDEPGPGVVKYTSRSALGSELSDASIMDLEVYNVRYRLEDLASSDDYEVTFRESSDYGGYDSELEIHARLNVPTAIDLSHGVLELRDDQGLVGDRFKVAEYATNTGDTNLTNVSDGSYTDVSASYSSKGDTVTLATSGINAGENLIMHLVVALQGDEASALKQSSAPMGPTGDSGGFLSGVPVLGTVVGWIMTPLGALVTAIGSIVAIAKKSG